MDVAVRVGKLEGKGESCRAASDDENVADMLSRLHGICHIYPPCAASGRQFCFFLMIGDFNTNKETFITDPA